MCEYCGGDARVLGGKLFDYHALIRGGELHIRHRYTDRSLDIVDSEIIDINYCPMCGRKLKENEE